MSECCHDNIDIQKYWNNVLKKPALFISERDCELEDCTAIHQYTHFIKYTYFIYLFKFKEAEVTRGANGFVSTPYQYQTKLVRLRQKICLI